MVSCVYLQIYIYICVLLIESIAQSSLISSLWCSSLGQSVIPSLPVSQWGVCYISIFASPWSPAIAYWTLAPWLLIWENSNGHVKSICKSWFIVVLLSPYAPRVWHGHHGHWKMMVASWKLWVFAIQHWRCKFVGHGQSCWGIAGSGIYMQLLSTPLEMYLEHQVEVTSIDASFFHNYFFNFLCGGRWAHQKWHSIQSKIIPWFLAGWWF